MGMDRERRRMKKPFFDHLKELNTRILFSLLLILIFGIYVYIEYHFFVEILNKPLIDAGYDQSNIFALTIYEGFQVKITNVFLISLILLLPLTLLNPVSYTHLRAHETFICTHGNCYFYT